MSDVTQLLRAIEQGDPAAADQLLPLVYHELRRLAAARMAREAPDHTFQATALVHEAYLRLVGPDGSRRWNGRAHFFAAAAEAMRRVLIQAARRRHAAKRGGDGQRVDLELDSLPLPERPERLLALDEALDRLAATDPAKAELVKLRFFAGLTIDETGEALGLSAATVERQWAYARAWLQCALRETEQDAAE
jgi:RNA polymerase sigma factor (TIGR02999 family)